MAEIVKIIRIEMYVMCENERYCDRRIRTINKTNKRPTK